VICHGVLYNPTVFKNGVTTNPSYYIRHRVSSTVNVCMGCLASEIYQAVFSIKPFFFALSPPSLFTKEHMDMETGACDEEAHENLVVSGARVTKQQETFA
jgi:hypothetical protein